MSLFPNAFKIVVTEPFLGVDTKNRIMLLQTEIFYNDNGTMAYSHNVVINGNPTKEEAFKHMLQNGAYVTRVSSSMRMTFDGRETRDLLPPNDDICDLLNDYFTENK